jgi:hypothetical protein
VAMRTRHCCNSAGLFFVLDAASQTWILARRCALVLISVARARACACAEVHCTACVQPARVRGIRAVCDGTVHDQYQFVVHVAPGSERLHGDGLDKRRKRVQVRNAGLSGVEWLVRQHRRAWAGKGRGLTGALAQARDWHDKWRRLGPRGVRARAVRQFRSWRCDEVSGAGSLNIPVGTTTVKIARAGGRYCACR